MTITATAHGYTAHLNPETSKVEIYNDAGGYWAGDGTWNGQMIDDCPAVLEDGVYDALDTALATALSEVTE